jgi:hypothetical protein
MALGDHGHLDFANIAADSFGNALGAGIVGAMESTPGQTQQQTQGQAGPGTVAADPGQQQRQTAAEAAAAAPSSDAPVTAAQVVAEAASNGDATTLNALQANSSPWGGIPYVGDEGTVVVTAPKTGFWSDLLSGDFSGAAEDAYYDVKPAGMKRSESQRHQADENLYPCPYTGRSLFFHRELYRAPRQRLLARHIADLRESFWWTRIEHPFVIAGPPLPYTDEFVPPSRY